MASMTTETKGQTMTNQELAGRLTKNSNVRSAVSNYLLWLSWYPTDYAGAVEFGGDFIETLAEAHEFEQCAESLLLNSTNQQISAV